MALTAHCVFQYDALGNGDITLQRAHIRKGLGIEVDFLILRIPGEIQSVVASPIPHTENRIVIRRLQTKRFTVRIGIKPIGRVGIACFSIRPIKFLGSRYVIHHRRRGVQRFEVMPGLIFLRKVTHD